MDVRRYYGDAVITKTVAGRMGTLRLDASRPDVEAAWDAAMDDLLPLGLYPPEDPTMTLGMIEFYLLRRRHTGA